MRNLLSSGLLVVVALACSGANAESPPVELSGQAMFRYTTKFDGGDDSAELYNLRLYLSKELDDFRFFAEPRLRQTPLRSFSPSNVWLQQAWIGYIFWPEVVTANLGLIYTRLGRFWDDSWFGNIPYLNALKLDPDYGVELRGRPSFYVGESADFGVEYSAQALPASDGLNGFFAPGFKLDRLGARPEDGFVIDFDSAPGFDERYTFTGRLSPSLEFEWGKLAAGGSFLVSELRAPAVESGPPAREGQRRVFGVDAGIGALGLLLGGDLLMETVEGFGAARERRYVMTELAYTWQRESRWFSKLQARVDFSHGEFEPEGVEEYLFAAGLFARLHPMLGTTVEYVRWEFGDEKVVNRIEWIAHAYF